MPNNLGPLVANALIRAGCVKRDGETLSTYRAAQLTGVNSRNIGQIVAGDVSPSIETLERLFQPIGWEVAVSFFPRNQKSESPVKRRARRPRTAPG